MLNILLYHYPATMISLIYCKINYLYFVSFPIRLIKNVLTSISNCNSFLSFGRTLHSHLLYISKTQNKKQVVLLNLLINCISARSKPLLLPLKDEYTLRFSNFLVIDSRNSPASCWFSETSTAQNDVLH